MKLSEKAKATINGMDKDTLQEVWEYLTRGYVEETALVKLVALGAACSIAAFVVSIAALFAK